MGRYQVKWTDKGGNVRYGIYRSEYFFSKGEKRPKAGRAWVDDAILPVCHDLSEKVLTDVVLEFNGEYDKYVEGQYEEALRVSDGLKGRVSVGSLFGIGVADGGAFYVVTRVGKKTCDVEWRGYGGDRYTDHYFGWGRRGVPIADVRRYVRR